LIYVHVPVNTEVVLRNTSASHYAKIDRTSDLLIDPPLVSEAEILVFGSLSAACQPADFKSSAAAFIPASSCLEQVADQTLVLLHFRPANMR
jgi:hypothetical protein